MLDPELEVGGVVFENSRPDRGATPDVGQLRTDLLLRGGASNCMAGRAGASLADEYLSALLSRAGGRRGRGCALPLDPGVEVGGGLDEEAIAHIGVLRAAELDALPHELAGLARGEPQMV